ncbi:hypothetical protein JCGZ_15384 [Jatropha curcas]|uniref:Uncharacterized protein n=1 Tax=Jatropha curcas TaxID=180498 RepID=A0A067K5X6_JATCU|nr:hypothetical protein JCGZ_15384 [Jatropha curcas]
MKPPRGVASASNGGRSRLQRREQPPPMAGGAAPGRGFLLYISVLYFDCTCTCRPQARAMVVDDQKAILLPLIDEFSETRPDDPDRMRLRIRAFVFCLLSGFLFNKDPGFGDLRLCPMIHQMEDMGCIDGIVLAETIRSVDRAALGFDNWTVSLIILQVWLKDHLQVVAAPTFLPYNPSQYRMRRILITHSSPDAWTSWLIELGPNEVLWYISWYDITRFIQSTETGSLLLFGRLRGQGGTHY